MLIILSRVREDISNVSGLTLLAAIPILSNPDVVLSDEAYTIEFKKAVSTLEYCFLGSSITTSDSLLKGSSLIPYKIVCVSRIKIPLLYGRFLPRNLYHHLLIYHNSSTALLNQV